MLPRTHEFGSSRRFAFTRGRSRSHSRPSGATRVRRQLSPTIHVQCSTQTTPEPSSSVRTQRRPCVCPARAGPLDPLEESLHRYRRRPERSGQGVAPQGVSKSGRVALPSVVPEPRPEGAGRLHRDSIEAQRSEGASREQRPRLRVATLDQPRLRLRLRLRRASCKRRSRSFRFSLARPCRSSAIGCSGG